MKNSKLFDKLMKDSTIKSLGLKREAVIDILKSYEQLAFTELLDNGCIELGNGMIIEVVQLVDRVHVLRGTAYKSSRKYKLKLTMEDRVYNRIEDYYEKLREEII